jgi:hypothetical protein
MNIEEEYQDVLQNLEATIIIFWQENPDLIDVQVENALDWLIQLYNAEIQGRSFSRPLRGISRTLADSIKGICEIELGRSQMTDQTGIDLAKKTPDEIVKCLKRLKSSVQFWTKKNGRQGYLNFVKPFIR